MEEKRIDILERELFGLEDYIENFWGFLPIPIAFISPLGLIMEADSSMETLVDFFREDTLKKEWAHFHLSAGYYVFSYLTSITSKYTIRAKSGLFYL